MTLQNFGEEIRKRVQENMGSGYKVECQEFFVNNAAQTLKLLVTEAGRHASPAITLNGYYENADVEDMEAYLEKTAGEIAKACRQQEPMETWAEEYARSIGDFSAVRDNIKFRLIHTEMNRELLETVPHIPFLDLSMVFYLSEELDKGVCSVLVHNELAAGWGVTPEELYDLAMENTPRLLPPVLSELKLRIIPMGLHAKRVGKLEEGVLYPASNHTGFYGAAVLAYPDFLRQYAKASGKNIIVIPSSVHEVLIKTEEEYDDRKKLSECVKEINTASVPREEWLSDHIYVYEYETDRLTAA